MAIYRPQRPRWRLALLTGAVGLFVGVLVGWGLLRPEPDPGEVLGDVRRTLASAAATLEVVEVEYAESVRNGRIVASPEYQGARDALASSRARYLEAREAVAAVAPNAASAIDASYGQLQRLIERRTAVENVSRVAGDLRQMLTRVIGG